MKAKAKKKTFFLVRFFPFFFRAFFFLGARTLPS